MVILWKVFKAFSIALVLRGLVVDFLTETMGLTVWWVLRGWKTFEFCVKVFGPSSQTWEVDGVLWRFWCLRRLSCLSKYFPHSSHSNETCFLCVLMYLFKSDFRLNLTRHSSNWNGFSFVCVVWCRIKSSFLLKDLGHWLHVNLFSPLCLFKWRFKVKCRLNFFLHMGQPSKELKNGFEYLVYMFI